MVLPSVANIWAPEPWSPEVAFDHGKCDLGRADLLRTEVGGTSPRLLAVSWAEGRRP
jgi:hypothetical protein